MYISLLRNAVLSVLSFTKRFKNHSVLLITAEHKFVQQIEALMSSAHNTLPENISLVLKI